MAFITGFSGAIMPGPFLVKVIEQTPLQGFSVPMVMMTGHALLEFIIVVLLVMGLRPLIARTGVRAFIGLVGGVALLYMACDMIRAGWGITLALEGKGSMVYSWPQLMLLGAGVSIVNPYFTGWWGTIGVGQMAQLTPRTKTEYFGFYVGHEIADFSWYGIVGLLLVTSRRWLTDGMYQWLIVSCGTVLLALGVWFFVTGWKLVKGMRTE
ncbi:LysE family transporter [bacterium]|nr:LysE family transporter [bacterium]